MINWWKQAVFENYANFNGRARRSEFWYFTLFNIIVDIIFLILIGIVASNAGNGAYGTAIVALYIGYMLYNLAMAIPTIAVSVRRLHDIDKSGWFYLIGFVPLVGQILLIIWFATEGSKGSNEYGHNPKEHPDSIDVIGLDDE